MVDTLPGAPQWFGLILSPWLAGPWLAGAWVARLDGSVGAGAIAGLSLLAGTVFAYLAMAGADATALLPGLPLLALVAGPAFGASGAHVHRGERGRRLAGVVLGATFTIEGVLLQAAADQPLARALLVAEAVAGVLIAGWIGGRRAGLIVLAAGAVVLGIVLVSTAILGPVLGE